MVGIGPGGPLDRTRRAEEAIAKSSVVAGYTRYPFPANTIPAVPFDAAARAPAARDPGRYAASLLGTVLGDDSGSRLYWELVDPGLAEHAEMSHCEYEGAGAFITYMSCMPEEAAGNLQRIFEVYRRVQAEGVTRSELEQAKSKWRSRIVLSGERPRGRLRAIGADWLYRREYRSVEDDLDTVAAVTVDDVAAILAKYPLNGAATITIGPLKEVAEPK
ncbi:MAG: insulinase family protein [candidate division NC10 bacterium]